MLRTRRHGRLDQGNEQIIPSQRVLNTDDERHVSRTDRTAKHPGAVRRTNGDRVAIDMILRNLVDNSLRHGGRGNVAVMMYVEAAGGTVTLRCVDNGVGCRDGSRLGNLFARGEHSQGAGIGLYLIRALMTQMGGSATYATSAGGGFVAQLQFRRGARGGG